MAQVIVIADHTEREVITRITVGPDWKLHGVELGRLWMEILEAVEEARRLEARIPRAEFVEEDTGCPK